VPGEPGSLVAVAGDRQISVTWSAPADNGGSPITRYDLEFTQSGQGSTTFGFGPTTTSYTIGPSGVTNGITYTIRVAASNAVGMGAYRTVTATPAPIGYNYANYNRVADWNGQDGNLTTVGTNGGSSYYGTFDQSGNVWEWNEAASGTSRCIRGGSWRSVAPSVDFQTFFLSSAYRTFYGANSRAFDVGFRIASSTNPLVISGFVGVGDESALADTTGYGAVNYAYQISAYPVTQSQYVEFLNAVAATDTNGIYSTSMTSDSRGGITRSSVAGNHVYSVKASMGNKPVNFVNWVNCARYCNWLHNGKPSGLQNASTTENGAYAISGTSTVKISSASYWIPTENEWYKAAYFSMSKNGGLGGYWKYATQSDEDPTPVSANVIGDGPFA
jgi:formylglycine-generating enzyme required for sulfatase activity